MVDVLHRFGRAFFFVSLATFTAAHILKNCGWIFDKLVGLGNPRVWS